MNEFCSNNFNKNMQGYIINKLVHHKPGEILSNINKILTLPTHKYLLVTTPYFQNIRNEYELQIFEILTLLLLMPLI